MKHTPRTFTVYLARCRATGKVYVGCTGKTLRERREQHHTSAANGSPYKFHKALREYGYGSFEWSVLSTVQTQAEAFRCEREFVSRYNSYRSGLNSSPGGAGSSADGVASRKKRPVCTQPKPRRRLTLWR